MPLLYVPYKSQWATGAASKVNDCGVAAVAMLLDFYGKLGGLTIDQLSAQTALASSDVGLMPEQLVSLMRKHGLQARVVTNTTNAMLMTEIDAGRPVIALIAYRYILGREDQADRVPGDDGHFIVVTGYDDTHFVANDSDYWGARVAEGHNTLIPIDQLDRALAPYGGQCVFLEELPLTDQIIALAKQIETLASQLASDAPPVVPPPPEPVPDGSIVVTVKAAVNVRTQPTTASAIYLQGGLGAGVEVIVSSASTPGGAYTYGGKTYTGWRSITARIGKGGYVAEAFLNSPQ